MDESTCIELYRRLSKRKETLIMAIPENLRERFYYVIPMPVSLKTGHGPADETKEFVRMTWEVWNQELTYQTSHNYLVDAMQECEKLNREYYGND